jgi:hypothetical protein
MRTTQRRSVTTVVVALLLGGATLVAGSAAAATSPSSSTPPGYRRIVVTGDRFGVAAPSSWLAFDFTLPAAASRYQKLLRAHPGQPALAPRLTSYPPDTQLYAADPSGSAAVTVSLAPGAARLPSLSNYRDQFASLSADDQPRVDGLTISHRPAILVVDPCLVSPPTPCPNRRMILAIGVRGVITFQLRGPATPSNDPTRNGLLDTIQRTITLG